MKFIVFISLIFIMAGCSSVPRFTNESDSDGGGTKYPTGTNIFSGTASYYADEFQGRKTASGEIYDMNKLTAAHRNFPFGTILKVTNLKNNKIVKVRINDRMPDFKKRIIDLSYGAAKEIDMIRDGVVEVRIEVIEWGK